MAERTMTTRNESNGAGVASPGPTTSRRKFVTLTAMMLILEAVVVVGAFSFFTGPTSLEATSTDVILDADPAAPSYAEVLVFDDRLYNDRLGQAFEYRVKIAVKVLDTDRNWVGALVNRFGHELHMELDTIWRSADPRHLREVDKRTLTGRVGRMLEQWVVSERTHAPDDGTPVIHDVIVVPSPGIRINR